MKQPGRFLRTGFCKSENGKELPQMGERMILALDIGASSGRGILGRYEEETGILKMEEIHRFENNYVRMRGGIYWDYVGIYNGVLDCLRACKKREIPLESIAIDTWAQDYAYIGHNGEILGLPRSYRDPNHLLHCKDMERDLCMDSKAFYYRNGGTAGEISTVRQLYYDRRYRSELFNNARWWVNMPYLLIYLLSDVAGYDVTIPALGELIDVKTMDISPETAMAVGIDKITPPRFQSGTIMAYTNQTVFEATGYDKLPIACIDAHDTSSAVDALPDTDDFLWISSGTYNMFGAVIQDVVLNDQLFGMNCRATPLGDGRICMMCGAAGMYFIQQCVKYWNEHGMHVTYPELTAYALEHDSETWFSFADLPSAPVNMPAEICAAIEKNGFAAPETPGDLYVAFANSLARATAQDLLALEKALGRSFGHVYVLGGGSKADAVNLRIARMTGKTLYTGLVEAASIGNLLIQLVAIGAVTREEAAAVSGRSFQMQKFELK